MKLVFWLLVAVVLFYGAYSGMMAVWSYFQINDIVEQAVRERPGLGADDRVRQVRDEIVKSAARSGLALDGRAVDVRSAGGALSVKVRWTYPVIVYNSETLFSIPLSVDRDFTRP
jgi:hypothetical protein